MDGSGKSTPPSTGLNRKIQEKKSPLRKAKTTKLQMLQNSFNAFKHGYCKLAILKHHLIQNNYIKK